MGGEEFIILLPNTTCTAGTVVADRLCSSLGKSAYVYDGKHVHITVSVGVAELERDYSDFERLVHRADLAMYAAKRLGRNRVFVDDRKKSESCEDAVRGIARIPVSGNGY
jgi:diguanylate cyclase (GGDEF)-like protein